MSAASILFLVPALMLQTGPATIEPAAGCSAPGETGAATGDSEIRTREKAFMNQICVEEKQAPIFAELELKAVDDRPKAEVEQLPDDIEVPEGQGAPEDQIVVAEVPPEVKLYREVADIWQTIRKRGQQPTPELIAREIGPDNLARFLDQNPGAEAAFGEDSDVLPVDTPDGLPLPDGSVFALPAADSGA